MLFDLFVASLVGLLLWRMVPQWTSNLALEGRRVPDTRLVTLAGETISLPMRQSTVFIFWESTCGPCVVELRRFRDAVAHGELDGRRVFALNLGEPVDTMRAFVRSERLNFMVVHEPSRRLLRFAAISATPTVMHLSPMGVIEWRTVGVSPLGILRAQSHLED